VENVRKLVFSGWRQERAPQKLVEFMLRRHVRQIRLAASYAFDVQFYASYKSKASHS